MMKIAILYIALGKYTVLWDDFYKSCESNFLNGSQKHYFVFSDEKLPTNERITLIEEKNYGWPGNSLYRFRFFLSIKDLLKGYDFCFFFNANAKIVETVGEDILPDGIFHRFVGVQHFRCLNKNPLLIGYDRNKKTHAFVKWGMESKFYVQASFFGGFTNDFLSMSYELDQEIREDEAKNVCPKWHDESYLNHFFCKKEPKVLPMNFAYSEPVKIAGYNPIILMRDKGKYGDLNAFRSGKKTTKIQIIKTKAKNKMFNLRCFINLLIRPKYWTKRQAKIPCYEKKIGMENR